MVTEFKEVIELVLVIENRLQEYPKELALQTVAPPSVCHFEMFNLLNRFNFDDVVGILKSKPMQIMTFYEKLWRIHENVLTAN